MRVKITSAAAGLILVAGLSACGSSNDTATQNEQYCTSSTTLQAELAKLKTMVTGGQATLNEVQDQVKTVEKAYDTTLNEAKDVPDAAQAEIQSAYTDFVKAVNAIPGTATVDEAAAAYNAAVAAYDTALLKIRTDVGCK